ncbi:MAG: hypothetical protein M3463_19525 [Verrucomicrobiota bacterium]|nr:hypothetical protein [Verrucomicrobiota bacterium]
MPRALLPLLFVFPLAGAAIRQRFRALGFNSRLKWIVQPGNDIYLVFNKSFDVEDGRFRSSSSEIATKLVWTFRF